MGRHGPPLSNTTFWVLLDFSSSLLMPVLHTTRHARCFGVPVHKLHFVMNALIRTFRDVPNVSIFEPDLLWFECVQDYVRRIRVVFDVHRHL